MSLFRAEKTNKISAFKAKKNAQKISEHPQKKYEKVEKTTFLALKKVKVILS